MLCTVLIAGVLGCPDVAGEGQGGRPAAERVVTVEGIAACTPGGSAQSCRHAALADALRRAVEKAVGVLVEADTRTEDFLLTRDTVRTTADGYVRDYRILNERMDGDLYRIMVEARVAPGSPVKPLKHLCRRLKESRDPLFVVSVDDAVAGTPAGTHVAGLVIGSELASLGLRVGHAGQAVLETAAADITIQGRAGIEPLGEPIVGTGIFTASASADLSVADSASGTILPCVSVSLGQPAAAASQAQANRQSAEDVAKLWIQRNLPLVVTALLDPGKPVVTDDAPRLPSPEIPVAIAPVPDTVTVRDAVLAPGPAARVVIEPKMLTELAQKLRAAVVEASEFAALPIEVAVARFKPIGLRDASAVEDVVEDLSTALVKTGIFELVERSQLDKVLQELRIQHSGLIDSATAKKLGKLVGAKAVLVGSISDRGDRIVINARLINTESGRVRIAESIVVDKGTKPEPVILRAGPRR